MAIINFKNVGVSDALLQERLISRQQEVIPIGFKTPMSFARTATGGLFEMNFTVANQIEDNLRNLISTNHGERIMRYDFGANLIPLLTDYRTEKDFDSEATTRIKTATSKYMPFIELEDYASQPDVVNGVFTGTILLYVKYSVPKANIASKTIEVQLTIIN